MRSINDWEQKYYCGNSLGGKIYECTNCRGCGWLGYSKDEMCQICSGDGYFEFVPKNASEFHGRTREEIEKEACDLSRSLLCVTMTVMDNYRADRLVILNDILKSMPNSKSIVDDEVWEKVLKIESQRTKDYISRM